MITTNFHKNFIKQYAKLPAAQKRRFEVVIVKFQNDPNDPTLYNHPLAGEWRGHSSIAFGGDWRAHYMYTDGQTALFIAIGTHSQLYK